MKTLILIFILSITTCLYSTIINVPADQPTIQAGINVAVNGDTVLVQPGTYLENINYNGKLITVASLFLTTQDTTYISQTIIDGNQNGSVVTFINDEDSTAVLCGFTITNGQGGGSYPNYTGGGISCFINSSPTITNNIITDNTADVRGGGIYCANNSSPTITGNTITGNTSLLACGGGIICIYNSSPTITGNTITGNTAGELGGGIECANNSSPIIADNTITLNHARAGGGISCYINSSPTITNNTITGNTVAYAGGGIVSVYGSSPTITDNIITGNAADSLGGGIGFLESSPTITHNTIEGNTAPYGGGIACGSTSSGTINSCTISGNSAVDEGGGIYCEYSSPILQNVIITDNTASNNGGGIYCYESNPSLENVTITGNSASDDGGGIYCLNNSSPSLINSILWNDSPQEIYFWEEDDPSSITISYSDVQGGEAGIVTNNNGTVNWLEGNLDDDPLFVGTGDHPFMLQDLSPCVNAGIPDTTGMNLPEFDLAGNPRVYGGRIDMGAYENQNVIVSTDEDLIPLITRLNQNYPNPFNPTTTINYSLKENSKVSLNIYNIKGQKVKQLVNEMLESGNHTVIWNGKDNYGKFVSSGIYFYKLKTGNYEKVKKMILLR